MKYTINQLAKLAGVSVRTLHHYDEFGLLSPKRNEKNDYRLYTEDELFLLQQILFFRELDFPLDEIKKIITSANFDIVRALKDHKQMILLKKKRIDGLLKTIDKTIKNITHKTNMKDEDLYGNFSKEEMEMYAKEAKERWGNTDAYKQSQARVAKMGKQGLDEALQKSGVITSAIADCMKEGVSVRNERMQKLIEEHYNWLNNFYEPNLEIYKGLAEMYVADPRFKKTYEDIAAGLAQYMQDGMLVFVENKERQ